MQPEGGGKQPLVLIDYSHTPDALAKALHAARAYCRGRLHCVFGCGGDRDPGKRGEMGGIAARGADLLVVTDDNPRSEDPAVITDAILRGVAQADGLGRVRVIHDRALAIRSALTAAAPDDVVLVAGKGHEEYQIVGAERRVFSDTDVVRAALRQWGGA
jgi:UDP-N-acetylmuramoyl-L-alanyl-D-glutamate--2,6-diaminopimelate ligase